MGPGRRGFSADEFSPRQFLGVTVSSTFEDLKEHRAALMKAIHAHGMHALGMEDDGAKPGLDLIDSSLQFVREGSAYVGVLSHRYGKTPECEERNPQELSITELEFSEAQRLGRPIVLFLMADDHPIKKADIESDPAKEKKLQAFRERAKQAGPDSKVHRIYDKFSSVRDFEIKAERAMDRLRRYLDENEAKLTHSAARALRRDAQTADAIPKAPSFYAEPAYTGSHKFLGRRAQLAMLDDWAAASDPNPVLLFDAIGGTGKSILTWTWINQNAPRVRSDWAGRFWYSFYEKGADMGDFCRRAVAYMTGQPVKEFRGKKTAELRPKLRMLLHSRPWLVVMDGLERILVAYNRLDAAELADEEANTPTDQIANRDPRSTIRPEDGDLLRDLASVAPSKVLITSRLVPTVLLAPSGQGIPGVRCESLPGLLAEDAEALFTACGVKGNSQRMRDYLKRNCDCHPLVIGILAGLVNSYHPEPGDFDRWLDDPAYGAAVDLGALDLIHRRNHILRSAIEVVPEESRKLLSVLALLSDAVDYATLVALNPFVPPEPEEIEEPDDPRVWWEYNSDSDDDKAAELRKYEEQLVQYKEREEERAAWQRQSQSISAIKPLARTIEDLKQRGLLQFDRHTKRYDLHPVVRHVAATGTQPEDSLGLGQRVVDHFTARAHNPWEQASALDDLRDGLHVVRTFLKIGKLQEACEAYQSDLASALLFNLEAYAEALALLRKFFPEGWSIIPADLNEFYASYLLNQAHIALDNLGQEDAALEVLTAAIALDLRRSDWSTVRVSLSNLGQSLHDRSLLAQAGRCFRAVLAVAELGADDEQIFRARLDLFSHAVATGSWAEAQRLWELLDPMGRSWFRGSYRPGEAEYLFARLHDRQGLLTETELDRVEELCNQGKNRQRIRDLHRLRGWWRQDHGDWCGAAESFNEAVRMAREVGQEDLSARTGLALAQFHLGEVQAAREEAEEISSEAGGFLQLAELWHALGERERAEKEALAAYRWAWADGEPYIFRFELDRAKALLHELSVDPPILPPYDPAKDGKYPMEDEVNAAIEKLRAEKASEKEAEEAEEDGAADDE
jgi:tetratricopeptide (TPR) repeat protein